MNNYLSSLISIYPPGLSHTIGIKTLHISAENMISSGAHNSIGPSMNRYGEGFRNTNVIDVSSITLDEVLSKYSVQNPITSKWMLMV